MKNLVDFLSEALIKNKVSNKKDYKYTATNSNDLVRCMNKIDNGCILDGERVDYNCIDVSQITDLSEMFAYDTNAFYDISQWNVSKCMDFSRMFYKSSFDGDISEWKVNPDAFIADMFTGSPLEGNEPEWYKKMI